MTEKWLSTVAKTGRYNDLKDKPTSMKNPNALTVQFNGTTNKTYDGSTAQTLNITPADIGAASSNHSHQYAGSSSAGGAANSAVKLATARTINGVSFDGTANITIADNTKVPTSSNSSITVQADSDSSTTSEYISLKAGGNELKIVSSGGGSNPAKNNANLTFNGNKVYNAGSKPTKADVGLGNVDNTSDANKPISTATQNALNGKLDKSGGTLTGNVTFSGDNELSWIRNTDYAKIKFKNTNDDDTDSYMEFKTGDNGNEYFKFNQVSGSTTTELMTIKSDHLRFKGNAVYHVGNKPTKADVGLGNVDNTSDANKPISTAMQNALNGKANSSHNHDIITGGNANRFDLTASNDCCGLSKQNNVDIKSWYGVSISNACGNTGVQGRPTVSFDARTGNAWFEGDIFVKGQSKGLFQSVSDGKSAIANAITGKGVSANSSDSFDTLASKIKQISTGTDTSSANATASDIALGKTAYVKGSKITGTNRLIKADSGSVSISSSNASKYGITYSRQYVNLQSDTSSYQTAYAYVFNIPVSNFNLNGANFMIEFDCSITNEDTFKPYYRCKTIMSRNGLGALAGYYSSDSSTSGAIYVSSSTVKGQNIGADGATVNVPFYIGGGSVSNFYYTLSWNYYGTK